MIKVYKALINVTFPNHHYMNELEFRNHALRYIREIRDPTLFFAKLMYFRDHKIEDPLTISIGENFLIHPGKNRYFGTSFRPELSYLDAHIYTKNKIIIPGITWVEYLEKLKLKNIKCIEKHNKTKCKTKFDLTYIQTYFREVTSNTRLELKLEDTILIANPTGKETLRCNVVDYEGVYDTVKYMFDQFPKKS